MRYGRKRKRIKVGAFEGRYNDKKKRWIGLAIVEADDDMQEPSDGEWLTLGEAKRLLQKLQKVIEEEETRADRSPDAKKKRSAV